MYRTIVLSLFTLLLSVTAPSTLSVPLSLLRPVTAQWLGGGDNKPLTVHIIAHSHCDPGWLTTFEGYYSSEVRLILDGVMRELTNQPHRKFVWSEISFFNRWYESLGKDAKRQFKKLVENGQIEFVNGGWVQNDEASPDPVAVINHMTTGHEYLLKNFGVAPRIGWQIDPFGHSSVTPSLWSLMGFDALVINRIHHSLKDVFKSRKQMEFIWQGADVGTNTDMFTHVLHTHYSAPPGYDWEEGAMTVDPNNAAIRARDFVKIMQARAQAYRTNHLLVPFGDDFKFKNAQRQFSNMDRLMETINGSPSTYGGMRLQYSTLSDYFSAVSQTKEVTFPVFEGDFYPYADNEDSYWTGYYTTRPQLKAKSRQLNHLLRACEMLLVLVRQSPHSNWDTERRNLPRSYWEAKFKDVERARMETALFLHHDAITGTSRSNVVADYVQRMDTAAAGLRDIMARMVEHLMTKEPNPPPTFTPDPIVFQPPEQTGVQEVFHPIVLFNSLGWVRHEVVSIRIGGRNVRVLDASNHEIPCQVDFIWDDLAFESLTPSPSVYEVSFVATIPPMGMTTYYVRLGTGGADGGDHASSSKAHHAQTTVYTTASRRTRGSQAFTSKFLSYTVADEASAESMFIENELLRVWVDQRTGMVSAVEEKKRRPGIKLELQQKIGRYATTRSGAYLFRPTTRAEFTPTTDGSTIRITRGPIRSTVATQANGADIVTRLYGMAAESSSSSASTASESVIHSLSNHISVSTTLQAAKNIEVVSAFSSPEFGTSATAGSPPTFSTNSGLDFMTRRVKLNVAASHNYYPMVYGARMTSATKPQQLTIVSSHSMAVGCHQDGELELMMHRWLAQDDGRGLAEPVVDTSRIEVPLWLSFDRGLSDLDFRTRSIRLNNPVRIFYKLPAPTSSQATAIPFMQHDHVNQPEEWAERQHVEVKPLKAPLPPHVHLLSLLARDSISDDIVIRLQHLDSSPDSSWVSSLSDLFEETFSVSEVRRATLALNTVIPLSRSKQVPTMSFKPDDSSRIDAASIPAGGGSGGGGAASRSKDSQNTEEEGVFLSQAALEKMRRDQEEAAAKRKAAGARRRLMQQMEQEPEMVDVRAALVEHGIIPMQQTSNHSSIIHSPSPVRRALFQSDPTAAPPPAKSYVPLFVLRPMQIHSYIFKLVGSEWAESVEGIMVGVGHTWQTKPVSTSSTILPPTTQQQQGPKKVDYIPPPQLQLDQPTQTQTQTQSSTPQIEVQDDSTPASNLAGVGAGVAGPPQAHLPPPLPLSDPSHSVPTPSNVLGGHEHTVIPGHTREAWHLIPSRVEYFVVLLASCIGVAFFMQALRVLSTLQQKAGMRISKGRKAEV